MNQSLKEGLRLRAIVQKQPIRFRGNRRVPLLENSLIWTSISRPGDPSVILGCLIGKRNEVPNIHLINGDPANDYVRATLYRSIASDLKERMDENPDMFQIIVGCAADAKQLTSVTIAAGKIGSNQPETDKFEKWTAEEVHLSRKLGLYLSFWVTRYNQQALQASVISLTDEINEHIATPLSDHERNHLGILLSWAQPNIETHERETRAYQAAQGASNHQAMGEDDEHIHEAIKELKTYGQISDLQSVITDMLTKLRTLHNEGYDLLASFPSGGELCDDFFVNRETASYRRFKEKALNISDARAHEYFTRSKKIINPVSHLTRTQTSSAAMSSFLKQERDLESDASKMLRIDPIARASGILDGSVVRGNVREKTKDGRYGSVIVHSEICVGEFEIKEQIEFLDLASEGPAGAIYHATGKIQYVEMLKEHLVYTIELERDCDITPRMKVEMMRKPFEGGNPQTVPDMRFRRNGDEGEKLPWTHSADIEMPIIKVHATEPNRVSDLFQKL